MSLLGLFTLLLLEGSPAPVGGSMTVALVDPTPAVTTLEVTSPVDAARLATTHVPLCRLARITSVGPSEAKLETLPPLTPALAAQTLNAVRSSQSAARWLLAAVPRWAVVADGLSLELRAPAADVARTLCHPAFWVPLGAFQPDNESLRADLGHPAGRPYLDRLQLTGVDARAAARLFTQGRVKLVLGAPKASEGPHLFATAAVLGPGMDEVRSALVHGVDRSDLARFFVPAPSAPLYGLLPAALGGAASPPRLETPAAPGAPRALTLLFDETSDHHRAVAQRLQVKLSAWGYRVALAPLAPTALRQRRLEGDELALHSVVLPPSALGALALWVGLAHAEAELPKLLAQGASDAVLERLSATLPVVPLVTRGLGVTAASDVQNLTFDELGLPRLDEVFLAPR